MMVCWVDGPPADALPLKDRGLAYGDGLFETLLVKAASHCFSSVTCSGSRWLDAPGHCCRSRLIRQEQCRAIAAAMGEGVMKLIVTRGDGLRGYAPACGAAAAHSARQPSAAYPAFTRNMAFAFFPAGPVWPTSPCWQASNTSIVWSKSSPAVNGRTRTRRRLDARQPGRVVEGVYSNLFMVRDGVLLTPDLKRCGVAGVMRAEMLSQAESWPSPPIADISLDQLQ